MPPLTLTILASALQLQGADATITSDNKGVDDLLAPLRYQLQQNVHASPRIAAASHQRGWYMKTYTRHYLMHYFGGKSETGTAIRPSGSSPIGSAGGKRR
jgi:hypothetical protein